MNAQHQSQPAPRPPAVSSLAEARKFGDELIGIMTTLLEVIERETELVRAGKLREAMKLESQKTQSSHQYVNAVSQLKASQPYLAKSTPELLATLHRHHDVFRAMLQVNLTVLATAHAVSEGIVRGVNTEMQRKSAPSTYNASGHRTAPSTRQATPLAVSRML